MTRFASIAIAVVKCKTEASTSVRLKERLKHQLFEINTLSVMDADIISSSGDLETGSANDSAIIAVPMDLYTITAI